MEVGIQDIIVVNWGISVISIAQIFYFLNFFLFSSIWRQQENSAIGNIQITGVANENLAVFVVSGNFAHYPCSTIIKCPLHVQEE